MKLKNILDDEDCYITYRTTGPHGEDILFGYCYWDGEKLKSKDGNSYSVEDEITKYELHSAGDLTVWYKSK